ncbi:MAG TPA: pantetheine-phosphate adenylyltransferase [Patescibacteria group bacterium]
MAFQYKLVAIGGTFGPLHKGHEAFLTYAFSLGQNVLIGLTTDTYIKQYKNDQQIPSFANRKAALETFLKENNFFNRVIIIPIDTIEGPVADNTYPVDALVVTENTKFGAETINKKRTEHGFSSLPIISMPLVKAEGDLPLASTHIRTGFMDTYGNPTWLSHTLLLPIPVREDLQKPFGILRTNGLDEIKQIPSEKIVSVGDVTTKRFLEAGIFPKLCVVDYVVERQQTNKTKNDFGFKGNESMFSVKNPPGSLTIDVWRVLLKIVENIFSGNNFVLEVIGEEDLLVLPLILVLPEGFRIFYGQPKKGLVEVEVTKEAKKKAAGLLNRFVS